VQSPTSDPRLSKLFRFDVQSEAFTPSVATRAANSNIVGLFQNYTVSNAPLAAHWDAETFWKPSLLTGAALHYERALGIMSDPTREEIQAQIAASEARGHTRIARLEGKIDTLAATVVGKIDALQNDLHKSDSYNRDTRLITIATIVAAAIAVGGLVVAMATYGDAMFGRGMNVRDIVQTVLKENAVQSKPK
jgi:hypothetical protein